MKRLGLAVLVCSLVVVGTIAPASARQTNGVSLSPEARQLGSYLKRVKSIEDADRRLEARLLVARQLIRDVGDEGTVQEQIVGYREALEGSAAIYLRVADGKDALSFRAAAVTPPNSLRGAHRKYLKQLQLEYQYLDTIQSGFQRAADSLRPNGSGLVSYNQLKEARDVLASLDGTERKLDALDGLKGDWKIAVIQYAARVGLAVPSWVRRIDR